MSFILSSGCLKKKRKICDRDHMWSAKTKKLTIRPVTEKTDNVCYREKEDRTKGGS